MKIIIIHCGRYPGKRITRQVKVDIDRIEEISVQGRGARLNPNAHLFLKYLRLLMRCLYRFLSVLSRMVFLCQV